MKKIYEEFIVESDFDIFAKEVKTIVEELKKLFEIYYSAFDPINMLDYKVSRIILPMSDLIDQEFGNYKVTYELRYKTHEKRKMLYRENRKSYDLFFNDIRNDMKQDLITIKRAAKDIINEIEKLKKLFKDNSDISGLYFKKFFKAINEKQYDGYLKFAENLKKGMSISDQEISRILIQEDFYKGNKPKIDERAFLFIDKNSYLNFTLIGG